VPQPATLELYVVQVPVQPVIAFPLQFIGPVVGAGVQLCK